MISPGDTTKISRLTSALFEPRVPPTSPEERRSARLVAMIIFTLAAVTAARVMLWFVTPGRIVTAVGAPVVVISLAVFLAAYALARRGMFRMAVWLTIATISAADFYLVFVAARGLNPLYSRNDVGSLSFLLVAVILADAFLSRRSAVSLATSYIVLMLGVPIAAPAIAWSKLVFGPVLLVSVTALLLVIVSAHRRQLELERSTRLVDEIDRRSEMQIELGRHRDELEVLVEKGALGLEAAITDLREANQAKDRFLANVSHELRTPLNSIIGFTGVIRQGLAGPLTEEQARQLTMVDRSSRHLLSLINQVLDLARSEAGEHTLEITTFPVRPLIREVAEAIEPLAAAKGLTVSTAAVRIDDSLTLTTDRGKVGQILLNLAGNAVKFTDAGTITLDAESVGSSVRLTVLDTGVGIEADDFGSVFGEYTQIVREGGAKPQGTGLGLTVSRHLAHLLNGEIELASEVGKGSEFSLTIKRS